MSERQAAHIAPRRFALVTPRFGRGTGGVGTSAERIVQHLRSVHRVQVFELCDEQPAVTLREAGPDHWRVGAGGDAKLAAQFLTDMLLRHAAGSTLLGFYAGKLAFPLWLASRLLDAPLVLFARGNDVDLDPFGQGALEQLHAWSEAAGILCVTRELERKIRTWAPRARTCTVPNGIDVEAFRRGYVARPARDARVRVGILGELKRKKGLEQLLAELDPARFLLHIVGTMPRDTEKLLHGMLGLDPQLAGSVIHHPLVTSHEALLERYAELDVVCLPSLHEGMANVMLEAMSLQKAIVASRVGGALDVLRDGHDAVTFEAFEEGALAAALDRIAQTDREALGRAAYATVSSELSAELECTRTLDALERMLA